MSERTKNRECSMYLNILYGVIAGTRSLLLADVDIFEHVLCGNLLCYQFVLRCVRVQFRCMFVVSIK